MNKDDSKIRCNIIVCGPAIGKTYLAEHDSRFVDVDGMKADYKYNLMIKKILTEKLKSFFYVFLKGITNIKYIHVDYIKKY